MLQEGPVIDAVDSSRQTPLMLATENGSPNLVSYLLSKNANWKMKDKDKYTAFDLAVLLARPKVVQVFLKEDSDKKYWKEVNSWIGLIYQIRD